MDLVWLMLVASLSKLHSHPANVKLKSCNTIKALNSEDVTSHHSCDLSHKALQLHLDQQCATEAFQHQAPCLQKLSSTSTDDK